jgi:hypothetical protein
MNEIKECTEILKLIQNNTIEKLKTKGILFVGGEDSLWCGFFLNIKKKELVIYKKGSTIPFKVIAFKEILKMKNLTEWCEYFVILMKEKIKGR